MHENSCTHNHMCMCAHVWVYTCMYTHTNTHQQILCKGLQHQSPKNWFWVSDLTPWVFSNLEAEPPKDIPHSPASSQCLLGSGTLTWLELKSFNVTLCKKYIYIYVHFWRLPSPCAWGIHVQTPKDWFTTNCQMSYLQKCQKPTRTENTI